MLSESEYRRKVYYGWCGKFLGGNIGAPYEGIKNVASPVKLSLSEIKSFANDDADYQIAWFEVLKSKGDAVTGRDLADYAEKNIWYPFGEYGYSMKNIRMGIYPPESGTFNNRFWSNGMGSPIRSELWAFIHPNQPKRAAAMAMMDSEIDHADESVWGEAFLSAMQSASFSSPLESSVQVALECIPSESRLAGVIRDVIRWHEDGVRGQEMRRNILVNYGHPDFTNSLQNIGFTLAALLSYSGEFLPTMELLLNFGYDADCTCATAGGTLGILCDESSIGDDLLSSIPDEFVLGIDVELGNHSTKSLAEDVCDYSIAHGYFNAADLDHVPASGYRSGAIVEYVGLPTVSPHRKSKIRVVEPGWSLMDGHPEELQIVAEDDGYSVGLSSDSRVVKDHYKLTFQKETEQRKVGFASSRLWRLRGPYFDAGAKQTGPYTPDGDPSLGLPGILEMFTSTASVDRAFVDEARLLEQVVQADAQCNESFFDYGEDVIPLDEHMKIAGPYCAYIWTYFKLNKPMKLWVIAGNNAPFALWMDGKEIIRDREHRYWMPCNNDATVDLAEGVHSVMLKAIRTDGEFKFSLAFKPFEECHYHRSHFLVGINWVY